MKWLRQKWLITQYFWRWLWMTRAKRTQQKALRKLVFNLMGNAPLQKIMNRESCSWKMTPGQEKGTIEGIQQYVKAVTGEDIKVAQKTVPTQTKTHGVSVSAQSASGSE